MPAQPVVDAPFLKLLAGVVGGDVLRPRRPPDLAGDEDGAHSLVRELDPADHEARSVGRGAEQGESKALPT